MASCAQGVTEETLPTSSGTASGGAAGAGAQGGGGGAPTDAGADGDATPNPDAVPCTEDDAVELCGSLT